jgi:hypothetical protein
LQNHLGVKNVVKVLDDFFFVELTAEKCLKSLNTFLEFCKEAHIPVAPHKTSLPCQVLIFLGVELDSIKMMARLPLDKLMRYTKNVEDNLGKEKITLRDLRSLIGQLQFATLVVCPGRAFLRRLINLTIGHKVPQYFIRLTKVAKLDLVMWHKFLSGYNGKTFMYPPHEADSDLIHLYTDASKHGFGGTYGSQWIQGIWPSHWLRFHIAIWEIYPILALVETFGHKFANSKIIFHCDNESVVEIINKQTSKDPHIMAIVRPLVLKLLILNTRFCSVHIPGVNNIVADAVSRFQETPALLHKFQMQAHPVRIPDRVHPNNLIA